MELLASCSLEESKSFTGKLSLPNEDAKSPDKVSLNVVVTNKDDIATIFESLSGNEKCVTFKGIDIPFCPDKWKGNVFKEINEGDDFSSCVSKVEGVITLVRLHDGYSDMRSLRGYCESYPTVRFIGGNLLQIDGVRIGRYDKGKDKGSPVYKDVYDTFVEVNLNDLSGIQEIVKKTRVKVEKKEKEKKEKTKKSVSEKRPAKRQVSFNNMFGGSEVEF